MHSGYSACTRQTLFLIIMAVFFIMAVSCSLNYDETHKSAESSKPELAFQSVIFNRYEDSRVTVSFTAEKLEQYRNNMAYARTASFDFWNTKNEKELTGSCRLLGMQQYKNLFSLYDDIHIINVQDESDIKASALQWNSERKTLVSDKSKTVRISKKSIEIEGQCFSAENMTNSYEFSAGVSGSIHTEDPEQELSE